MHTLAGYPHRKMGSGYMSHSTGWCLPDTSLCLRTRLDAVTHTSAILTQGHERFQSRTPVEAAVKKQTQTKPIKEQNLHVSKSLHLAAILWVKGLSSTNGRQPGSPAGETCLFPNAFFLETQKDAFFQLATYRSWKRTTFSLALVG